jgi:hypothetical protein
LVETLDRELGSRAKFGDADPRLASSLSEAAEAVARYERGELDLAADYGTPPRPAASATAAMTESTNYFLLAFTFVRRVCVPVCSRLDRWGQRRLTSGRAEASSTLWER